MPIDRIPGVGPTNADIATAVAAPSAATIAATVAAPSAATIATAVAAAVPTLAQINTSVTNNGNAYNGPSAATIASTTAASVPTLAQINTSVATNAPSPNAWTLITSTAATGLAVTFSGLSGYKTYKVVFHHNSTSGTSNINFNGDYTNIYSYGFRYFSGASAGGVSDVVNNISGIQLGASGTYRYGNCTIERATLSGAKHLDFTMIGGGSPTRHNEGIGLWQGTAAITSITYTSSTNMNTGLITLYGAN
jgi:hypothetical protein